MRNCMHRIKSLLAIILFSLNSLTFCFIGPISDLLDYAIDKYTEEAESQSIANFAQEKVSDETKIEMAKLLKDLNVTTPVEIRKVTPKLVEAHNYFKYGGVLQKYVFVNEEFFQKLTFQERKFMWAYHFFADSYFNSMQQKLAIGNAIAIFITSFTTHYICSKYNLSWRSELPIGLSFGAAYLFCQYKLQKKFILNTYNFIVEKFNCRDGAIEYLKRLTTEDPEFAEAHIYDEILKKLGSEKV